MELIELVPARVLRAVALIAGSLLAIAGAGVLYVAAPTLPAFGRGQPMVAQQGAHYRVSAIDFIDPLTGWIVIDFDSGGFSILHTDDGGAAWTRQLSGVDQGRAH